MAQRLAAHRSFAPDPDNVFLAAGAGGAISILLEAFINSGDAILVEEFTYMGSLRMMLERCAQPIHIPCDDGGMLPDALNTLHQAGRRAKFVRVVPVYRNPLGFTVMERELAQITGPETALYSTGGISPRLFKSVAAQAQLVFPTPDTPPATPDEISAFCREHHIVNRCDATLDAL